MAWRKVADTIRQPEGSPNGSAAGRSVAPRGAAPACERVTDLVCCAVPIGLWFVSGFWGILLVWTLAMVPASALVPVVDAATLRMTQRRGTNFGAVRAWVTWRRGREFAGGTGPPGHDGARGRACRCASGAKKRRGRAWRSS